MFKLLLIGFLLGMASSVGKADDAPLHVARQPVVSLATASVGIAGAPADDAGRALLGALEAYEKSIESVHWKQTSFTPPCSLRNRSAWTVLETSEQYIDAFNTWFVKNEMLSVSPPKYEPAYSNDLYLGADSFRLSWSFDSARGMYTQADGFQNSGTTMMRTLGRSADYDNQLMPRPVFELLESAHSLEVVQPEGSWPWPGLRAKLVSSKVDVGLEVRLDPDHGFAPCAVRIFRNFDGLELETLVVVQFMHTHG